MTNETIATALSQDRLGDAMHAAMQIEMLLHNTRADIADWTLDADDLPALYREHRERIEGVLNRALAELTAVSKIFMARGAYPTYTPIEKAFLRALEAAVAVDRFWMRLIKALDADASKLAQLRTFEDLLVCRLREPGAAYPQAINKPDPDFDELMRRDAALVAEMGSVWDERLARLHKHTNDRLRVRAVIDSDPEDEPPAPGM